MADARILDRTGRPYSLPPLYPQPSYHKQDARPKQKPRAKIYQNVTARERDEIVDCSKTIAARVPNINAALKMKADNAVGDAWHVRYRGTNRAWGRRMMAYINETFYRDCNLLGRAHDFHTSLTVMSHVLDKEADYGCLFDEPTGKFMVVDYSRIGTGNAYGAAVGAGLEQCNQLGKDEYFQTGWGGFFGDYTISDNTSPFFGRRIIDGVIVENTLAPVGYRLLGYNDSGKPTYCDMPAGKMHFNYEAGEHPNQLRGIPALANLIDEADVAEDAKYYWGIAIKIAAHRAVARRSKDGRPATAAIQETPVDVTQTDGTTKRVYIASEAVTPGITELSTDNEEEIVALDFNRPSMEESKFIQTLETGFFHKHWPRSLIYGDEPGRAFIRAIVQQVRSILVSRQRTLEKTARWIVDRAIAHAMRKGLIPENNAVFDSYNYEFTVPGIFTVDEGNDGKLQLMQLGRCTITRGIIAAQSGYMEEELLDQRAGEVDRAMTAAEKLSQKHPEWTAKEAMKHIDDPQGNLPAQIDVPPEENKKPIQ